MSNDESVGWVDETYAREHQFERLAVNVDEWTSLYRCPSSGDLWKKYFPFPEMHGGGPPRFERISQSEAEKEFRINLM
jgi:hypothetical protein